MQINHIMNLIGTRCLSLLKPQQVFSQQNMKYVYTTPKLHFLIGIMILRFCERYIRAKENVSFLKMVCF